MDGACPAPRRSPLDRLSEIRASAFDRRSTAGSYRFPDRCNGADLTTSDGKTVNAGGGTWTSPRSGNAWVTSQHFGPIGFLDIGDTHIGGDSTETWGVLITYQGEELVGRYEGEGALDVAINQFGQATLMGMDLRQVALPGLTIGQSAVADAAQSPTQ